MKLQTGPAVSVALGWSVSDLTGSVVGLHGAEEGRKQQETVHKQR